MVHSRKPIRRLLLAMLLYLPALGLYAGSVSLPPTINTGPLQMTGVDPQPKAAIVLPKNIQTGELAMTGIDPTPKASPPKLPSAISTGELRMTGMY